MTVRDFSIDEHRKMNMPPETFIRVPHGAMEAFVAKVGSTVGLDGEKAALLARLLTENDLRGTFSHGTQAIARYARAMRDGSINPSPEVRVVRETHVSLMVDGDGGLGYFPAYEGTLRAIEKAKTQGMAVMVTRNHGHIGAAGIYTRMTLEHDLLSMITGGSQMDLHPGQPAYVPAVGSPSSFSAPAGEEAPFVLDFGALYDLRTSPHYAEVVEWLPSTVFRCIGLGVVSKVWGGLLAGLPTDPTRSSPDVSGSASLLVTFQIGLFTDSAQFKREMDEFVRRVGKLEPLAGFDKSQLAGGPESDRERQYKAEGIPVGPEHQASLKGVAEELGVAVPW